MPAPQQLRDTCLPFAPHQDCLQLMQDGPIRKNGYLTGLFAKPEGVQKGDFTENYFGHFSSKNLTYTYVY